MTDEEVANLAADLHCGPALVRDLLKWAGGNEDLVREASRKCDNANQMKAYIIDKRVGRIEKLNNLK